VQEEEGAGLIILGKQAIDDDSNQTGQMLAALLSCRRAPSPARLSSRRQGQRDPRSGWRPGDGEAQPGNHHDRPAPQRAALRLAAEHHEGQAKPLATKTPADYGVDIAPRLETLKVVEPPKRSAGIKVADVDELAAKLKALGVAA
jgi:electron transfer flavoprotein beta subunit